MTHAEDLHVPAGGSRRIELPGSVPGEFQIAEYGDITVEPGATLTIAPEVLHLRATNLRLYDTARVSQESAALTVLVEGEMVGGLVLGDAPTSSAPNSTWDLSGAAGTTPPTPPAPSAPTQAAKGADAGVGKWAEQGTNATLCSNGRPGDRGSTGAPARRLILDVDAYRGGIIYDARGGRGGDGARGGTGSVGQQGGNGGNVSFPYWGNGAPGGHGFHGGTGGPGGPGGDGGDGGVVYLGARTLSRSSESDFKVAGGEGGSGGAGGDGGDRGMGGSGGQSYGLYHSGATGARGQPGAQGPPGDMPGSPGNHGQYWVSDGEGRIRWQWQYALTLIESTSLEIPDCPAYGFGTAPFTAELWLSCWSPGPLLTSGSGAGGGGWELTARDDGSLVFSVGSSSLSTPPDVLSIGSTGWNHVAVARRGSDEAAFLEVLVDGRPLVSAPVTSVTALAAKAIAVGSSPFMGQVDELRLWSYAREPFELDQGRYHHMPPDKTGLAGQFSFDGPSTRDSSAVGNHARLKEPAGGSLGGSYADPFVHWVPEGQPYVLTRTRLFEDHDASPKDPTGPTTATSKYLVTVSLKAADGSPYPAKYKEVPVSRADAGDDNGPKAERKPVPNVRVDGPSTMTVAGSGSPGTGPGLYAPNTRGELLISLPASGANLTAPHVTVTAEFMRSTERIVIAPDRDLHEKLASIDGATFQEHFGVTDEARADGIAKAVQNALASVAGHDLAVTPESPELASEFWLGTEGPHLVSRLNRQYFLPRDEACPCNDRKTAVAKTFYVPIPGRLDRVVCSESMEHPQWSLTPAAAGPTFRVLTPANVADLRRRAGERLRSTDGVTAPLDWFKQFVEGTLEGVEEIAVSVAEGLSSALDVFLVIAGEVVTRTVTAVEDAVSFAVGLIKQALGELVATVAELGEKLLEALRTWIEWTGAEIRDTRDAISQVLRAGRDHQVDWLRGFAEDPALKNRIDNALIGLEELLSPENNLAPSDVTGNQARQQGSSQETSLLQLVLDSPEAKWIQNKIESLSDLFGELSPLEAGIKEPPIVGSALADFVGDGSWLLDVMDDVGTELFGGDGGESLTQAPASNLADAGRVALTDVIDRIRTSQVIQGSVGETADCIEWLADDLFDAPLKIPVISQLVGSSKGGDASALDIVSAMIAVPAIFACHAVLGHGPVFESSDHGEDGLGAVNKTEASYKTWVVIQLVVEQLYAGADTYVDVRTILKRTSWPDTDFWWRAKEPAQVAGGWISFGILFVCPWIRFGIDLKLDSMQLEQTPIVPLWEATPLDILARAADYSGAIANLPLLITWPNLALRCGIWDTLRVIPHRGDPTGIQGTAGRLVPPIKILIGTVQSINWFHKASQVDQPRAKANAICYGVFDLMAHWSKAWVLLWRISRIEEPNTLAAYWLSFAGFRSIGATGLNAMRALQRLSKGIADFDFTISRREQLTASFTDFSSAGQKTWSWNFGDRSPASTEQNPTHTYARAGTYVVSLTVQAAAWSDTKTRRVRVPGTRSPRTLFPHPRVERTPRGIGAGAGGVFQEEGRAKPLISK